MQKKCFVEKKGPQLEAPRDLRAHWRGIFCANLQLPMSFLTVNTI